MALKQYGRKPFEIFTIDDIFTEEEVAAWIAKIDDSCTKEDIVAKKVRPFSSIATFHNAKVHDPFTADRIRSAITPHLPSSNSYESYDGKMWKFEEAAKSIMFAKVNTAQDFGMHTDTGCEFDKARNRFSKFTVLSYLNSDDLIGGKTEFYDDSFRNIIATIVPRKNRTLVFDIDLFHKGHSVISGCKYWIGTELVCSRVP
jgi:hypothetical protein